MVLYKMDYQISKTTFFQGAGDDKKWTYTKTSHQGFRYSTRNPPVPDILPEDNYVIGITYYERDPVTKDVTSNIADTQYSVTGSMSFGEIHPIDAARRELREELGVDCDNSRNFASVIEKTVGRQTYYTFVIPATLLRPITEAEVAHCEHVGNDDRSRKVQIFVHGTKTEIEQLLASVKFRLKTTTETDLAGVTIIPVEMVKAQYQKSVRKYEQPRRGEGEWRGGYRDGYRSGYRDGYRDGYCDYPQSK